MWLLCTPDRYRPSADQRRRAPRRLRAADLRSTTTRCLTLSSTSALGADAERARLGDSGAGDARPSAGRGRGADDSAGDIAAASPELAAGAAEPPPVSVDEASSPAGTGGDPAQGPAARALDVGAWAARGGPGVVEAGLAADGASLLGGAAEGAEEGASLNTRVSGDGDAGAWRRGAGRGRRRRRRRNQRLGPGTGLPE